MADNVIKVSVTSTKSQRVSVSSSQVATNITASPDTGRFWSQASKNWAVSENIVDGEDYSSKYYANKSKQFAQNAESYLQSTRESYNSFVTDANTYINEMIELKETGAVEINEAVASGKDEISSVKTTILNDIEFVADGEKKEIEDLADLIKENAEEIANRTSFAMFDTILKDHVLTYEESKGLALQGTYVYKEAVAGSRYGYPDFYNKCLEEMGNSTQEVVGYIRGEKWEQPINPSGISSYLSFADAQNAFDGNSSTYTAVNNTSAYIEYDLGQNLSVSGFTATGLWVSGQAAGTNLGIYSVDAEGNETLLGTSTGESNSSSPYTLTCNFTPVICNKLRFKATTIMTQYPSRIAEIKLIANVVENIYAYKNPNGHLFYNIADKEVFDNMFNSTGMAWFYGVDTENERVFLPRNNYFEQATGDVSEVGQSVEAGLPMHRHLLATRTGTATSTTGASSSNSLSFRGEVESGDWKYQLCSYSSSFIEPEVLLSGKPNDSTYGNSDTVQPPAVKKLLYICVGNTVSQSTITDVVDVTTTKNDTTPLFTGMYFDFKPNNLSWLKAGEQANNAGIYKTCYNELVNVLNGETKYGDLKVIDTTNMISGVDYSEYWKVNQTDMTFTTPTAISNKAYSDIAPVVGNGYGLGLVTDATSQNVEYLHSTSQSSKSLLGSPDNAIAKVVGSSQDGASGVSDKVYGVSLDPTKSGIEARLVENKSAQLYFKVANAVQNLELLDVGRVMEETVLRSHLVEAQCVTETYINGKSGYRHWSDGYHEEWGAYTTTAEQQTPTITFLKPFKTTNYIVYGADSCKQTAGDKSCKWGVINITNSSFGLQAQFVGHAGTTIYWKASGY